MFDHENSHKNGPEESDSRPEPKKSRMCGWWKERSLPQKILVGICFGVVAMGFVFLCGWIVMLLWNWLMPEIFGLRRLTYWQAWGLMLLCHILFKGRGSPYSGYRSDRKRRRQLRRYMQEDPDAMDEALESK